MSQTEAAASRPDSPPKAGITVAEIRDYFCCPLIWWFRNQPLTLEQQEQLMRVRGDPEMGRYRLVAYEVQQHRWLLAAIVVGAVALITWLSNFLFPFDIGYQILLLNTIGSILTLFAVIAVLRWARWRARTPRIDTPIPGQQLLDNTDERTRRISHAPRYGISGALNVVFRHGGALATMEPRFVETPQTLSVLDQMQMVAHALLAEAEFGQRPKYAYLVCPDRTFEVRITSEALKPLLRALEKMRAATQTGKMPEERPAWHLCAQCPHVRCPKRVSG